MSVAIFQKDREDYIRNDDGDIILFESIVDAKNFLFSYQYTLEYVENQIEFRKQQGGNR
jgi:hypothetical protein